MKDFYISDPHFGHKLVSGLRGFDNPHLHDRYLYDQWLEGLPANETIRLWILGDNYCSRDLEAEAYALRLLQQFQTDMLARKNSMIELHGLLGNHDLAHPMHRRYLQHLPRFTEVFTSVQTTGQVRMAGQQVLLSHFPYSGDHEAADRAQQFRLRDLGQPLIHGHTHFSEQLSWSEAGTLQICVCVEACPDSVPVAKETIDQLIQNYHHP
ncbi:MAG: serine/threonine protein phosphatase [Corynebacterium sp.]|nr:serine/threonine protein phosphatase [Corynebacterium sp.]